MQEVLLHCVLVYLYCSECICYQQVHHVWFVVSQRFHSVENIDASLLSQHLTHDTDAAEHAAATASVPEERQEELETFTSGVLQLFTTRWRQHITDEHRGTPSAQCEYL